ncbi:MAG: hypothetical protein JWR69_1241 [Pedosphaera sp.]|nr:hypothetical protein [Pedosphaera sp.]
MRYILPIALLMLFAGCASRNLTGGALVAKIHNNHIRWDGNYFGLQVTGISEAEEQVLRSGLACRPFLIAALADESRFVAAHVLLTKMQDGSSPVSAETWNHLTVKLDADGHVEIPTVQRAEIQRLWTRD